MQFLHGVCSNIQLGIYSGLIIHKKVKIFAEKINGFSEFEYLVGSIILRLVIRELDLSGQKLSAVANSAEIH